MSDLPTVGRQLRSLVKSTGELELSLQDAEVQQPGDNEVLVRVEAAPINPSDLGLLLAMSDVSKANQTGSNDNPVVTAPISENIMGAMAARVDQSMPVGNEGAGVVIGAGCSDELKPLWVRPLPFLVARCIASTELLKPISVW